MKLENLKQEIPFKWRVQSANQYGASCVAYIDARDCQDLLDQVCGQENWQDIYYESAGLLFCKVGIKIEEDEWVWKSDTGSESNVEKNKGHVSDAFKRSCVVWGIGRFLYSMPIVKLPVKEKNGKFAPCLEGRFIYGDDITKWCNASLKGKLKPNAPDKISMNGRVLENLLKGIAEGKAEDVKVAMKKYSMTKDQENALNVMISTNK